MGRHTKLISFPKPDVRGQVFHTLTLTCVLHICSIAICLCCVADTVGQLLGHIFLYRRQSLIGRCCSGLEEVVHGPLPPFESRIILGDLALGIEDVPGVDLDRDN